MNTTWWRLRFVWDVLCCYGRLLRLAQEKRYGGTLAEWWGIALAAQRYSYALWAEDWWAKGRSVDWRRMTAAARAVGPETGDGG